MIFLKADFLALTDAHIFSVPLNQENLLTRIAKCLTGLTVSTALLTELDTHIK